MGNSVRSYEYTRYSICEKMGWDYYTFESQPVFFIEEILIFMLQEHEKVKKDARR